MMRCAAASAPEYGSDQPDPIEDLTPAEMTVEVAVEVGFGIL